MKKIFLISLLMGFSGTSMADNKTLYFKSGLSLLDVESQHPISSVSPDSKSAQLLLGIGKSFNDYFAIEGRFSIALGKDTTQFNSGLGGTNTADADLDRKLSNTISIFALGQLPLHDKVRVYAGPGWTRARHQASYEPFFNNQIFPLPTIDENGLSLIAGSAIKLSEKFGVNLEYNRLLDTDRLKISGASLMLTYAL